MREAKRADVLVRRMVTLAQVLGGAQTDNAVLGQETKKVFAADEVHLARRERFGGDFIRLAGDGRAQTHQLARLGNLRDQRLAFARTGGQLGAPRTEHEDAARRLPFDKQQRAFREEGAVFESLKLLQPLDRQVTEEGAGAQAALDTIFNDLHSVW